MILLVLLVEQPPHTHSRSLKPPGSAKKEADCSSRLRSLWLCNRLHHDQQNWMTPAGSRKEKFESKFSFTFLIEGLLFGQSERRQTSPGSRSHSYQRLLFRGKPYDKYLSHLPFSSVSSLKEKFSHSLCNWQEIFGSKRCQQFKKSDLPT